MKNLEKSGITAGKGSPAGSGTAGNGGKSPLLGKSVAPAGSGTAGNGGKSPLLGISKTPAGSGTGAVRHTVELVRTRHWKDATVGRMLLDGSLECFTLEPPATGTPHPCIRAGRYRLDLRPSVRFRRPMLHLEDRNGRSAILIHAGNTASDTRGCILLGDGVSGPSAGGIPSRLTESAAACRRFYLKVVAWLDRGETDGMGISESPSAPGGTQPFRAKNLEK